MSLWICWVSRRLQRQLVSAMPSSCQRLPQKTSGLFDTSFAGSSFDAASSGVNALAAEPLATEKHFLLSDFEANQDLSIEDLFHLYPDVNPGVSDQPKQLMTASAGSSACIATEGCSELEDTLADLDTDPLGDSSLDAFVNLDQLLMGDTFLDEVSEVEPVIEMKSHSVEPVISILSPAGGDHQYPLDFLDLLDDAPEIKTIVQNPSHTHPANSEPSTSSYVTAKKSVSRKRKATGKPAPVPVKTSMFEIPMPISENVITTTFISPCSPELDHAYTSKLPETTLDHNVKPSTAAIITGVQSIGTEATCGTSTELVDKQSIRRHKNNIASKRSREQRKQKFSDLDREAEELVTANEALRQKIVELEKMAKEMKAALVAKMSGK
ncbi:transcription factor protein [Plakobranchus ocellatus]|uniref:Transcription factor protein n=1 Tax=Plakobranchus ocellatus TaxID=259542 RepID=A0AAV4CBY0_9GAST|nr:transcription factor protein [Plakobranchus ocellatus]